MRLRLHHRYFLTILALITAAVVLVSAALLVQYERSMAQVRATTTRALTDALTRQFQDRARSLALVMAEALVNPLALLSVEGIEEVIRSVEVEPDLITVALHDHAGRVLFDGTGAGGPVALFREPPPPAPPTGGTAIPDRPTLHEADGIVAATAPVRLGDQILGAITVRLATDRLDADVGALLAELATIDGAARRGRVAWLLAIGALMLALATLSTVVAARGLSRPIEVLSRLTARVGRGEYDVEVPAHRRADEIGDLARSLEATARNLRRTTVSRDKFDRIVGSMRDGLVVTTPAGVITDANGAAARLLGWTVRELVGRPISALVSGGEAIVALRRHDLLRAGSLDSLETTVTARDGRSTPVLLSASTMGGDSVQGVVWVFHDIAERKRAEAQIRHMAHHDALTGLPNRVLFQDRLRQAVAYARRAGEPVALLLLDLDHFKEINDGLGHGVGDAVLTAVAARLRSTLRESDTVARLGGDEFAIVQTGARQPDDAETLCRRLVEVVTRPLRVQGLDAFVGVSIGVALYPADGAGPDDLLRNADMALYYAKAEGRRTHRFFEGRLDAQLRERQALELDLRRALARGELELHYQPQVEIATRRLIGFEALLRWQHPERGRVPPDTFIPVAERTGLIVPIGEWVLRTACAQAAAWRREGGAAAAAGGFRIAVNLSPAQFHHRDLAALVRSVLDETGLPPRLLELEITEGILMHYTEANLATLGRIRGLGVRIGMDDFGTGYSSLGHLRRFPFDTIKIDRSFVRDLGRDADAAAVVRAAVTLGRSLGMACLAEGVETIEQLTLLQREGCREAQGNYFGAAAPAAEIGRMLAAPPGEAFRSGPRMVGTR